MADVKVRQAEVLDGGGVTMAWLDVRHLDRRDLGVVYRVTLTLCARCGRKCSPDAIRCHCGEACRG